MIRKATFSECGKYRYVLERKWSDEQFAMCVGLNPSTANADTDDNTITILTNALQWLGYGGFKMVNLYAFIASNPDKLFSAPDPMGENEKWVTETAETVKDIIFCWGSFSKIEYRAKKMINTFPNALCFGRNANGSPWHPRALHYAGIKSHETSLVKFRK